jgi:hypothetical protein
LYTNLHGTYGPVNVVHMDFGLPITAYNGKISFEPTLLLFLREAFPEGYPSNEPQPKNSNSCDRTQVYEEREREIIFAMQAINESDVHAIN